MKKVILVIIVAFNLTTIFGQTKTMSKEAMIKVIKNEFKNYNAQNWEELRKGYSDTLKVYSFPNCETIRYSNPEELITRYKEIFKQFPKNNAVLTDIIVIGNKVIVKEKITGRGDIVYAVPVFELDEYKIVKLWLIR